MEDYRVQKLKRQPLASERRHDELLAHYLSSESRYEHAGCDCSDCDDFRARFVFAMLSLHSYQTPLTPIEEDELKSQYLFITLTSYLAFTGIQSSLFILARLFRELCTGCSRWRR